MHTDTYAHHRDSDVANPQTFINRKGFMSHNALCAFNFDLLFTFLLPGPEGSANDSMVLHWACEKFGLTIGEPNYYLVDGGYGQTKATLAPYRGTRYHLKDFGDQKKMYVLRVTSVLRVRMGMCWSQSYALELGVWLF